mmetsp:Transcript_51566/g.124479  ORF Transcript_51566/g.124479 Transcript_51566/m.124479 type:complete len:104 (+) Transcript_51566:1094-1405(+)
MFCRGPRSFLWSSLFVNKSNECLRTAAPSTNGSPLHDVTVEATPMVVFDFFVSAVVVLVEIFDFVCVCDDGTELDEGDDRTDGDVDAVVGVVEEKKKDQSTPT